MALLKASLSAEPWRKSPRPRRVERSQRAVASGKGCGRYGVEPLDALVHSAERAPSQSNRETITPGQVLADHRETRRRAYGEARLDVETEADKGGVSRAVPGRTVRDIRGGPAPAHTYSHYRYPSALYRQGPSIWTR
jgi:hypothetical protein